MMQQRPGRVTVDEGVVIGEGGGRELRCDVYMPPEPGEGRPGVLLVHGGGWRRGDRKQLRGYGILLGRLGYVCVAAEYRLSGEAKWPAQIHDVKASLRWMRANADRLGVDPEKIAVSGNSAGAHLALMVAGTPGAPDFEGSGSNPGVSTDVTACIAFYAPVRLAELFERATEGAVRSLFDLDAAIESIAAASPDRHVSRDFPPTLLISGNADKTVSYKESVHMYQRLIEAGARAELHVYEGAPHAFDALPDFGRQCASIMALFLDRVMTNPRPVVAPQTTIA